MNGTVRLAGRSGIASRATLAVGLTLPLAALVACGGAAPPPTAPVGQEAASPATEPAAASSPDAPAAAVAPGDGTWPFASALSEDERLAQLERLKKDPGPLKSNWVPPGKTERYGHAEGLIAAPVDAVRARLLEFRHYKELAGPKFKTVRVVDKQGQSTDVYFQLPIMKGLVTIWYVTRFPPARSVSGGDVLEGTFVKGNIKGMHIAFTVRPGADDKSSVLVCDLILRPNVPAPQAALDEELRDACGDAINSLRKTLAANP